MWLEYLRKISHDRDIIVSLKYTTKRVIIFEDTFYKNGKPILLKRNVNSYNTLTHIANNR